MGYDTGALILINQWSGRQKLPLLSSAGEGPTEARGLNPPHAATHPGPAPHTRFRSEAIAPAATLLPCAVPCSSATPPTGVGAASLPRPHRPPPPCSGSWLGLLPTAFVLRPSSITWPPRPAGHHCQANRPLRLTSAPSRRLPQPPSPAPSRPISAQVPPFLDSRI
jgi:hypothetical protein